MYALAIHGGAGTLSDGTPIAERDELLKQGLSAALTVGQRILESGGNALDAVEAAVVVLEDDPQFNAGRGAVLTGEGTVELDAAIMDGGTLRAGAVAQLRQVRNPIRLARHILESLPHVFLVGDSAERYAVEVGLALVPQEYFITAERREQLAAFQRQQLRQLNRAADAPTSQPAAVTRLDCILGTIGAVARDRHGHVAAATSTGGMVGKRSGRVGDSPVIGAGTYADDYTCGVSATGHGEWLLRTVQAYDIAARMRYGAATLQQAVDQAMQHLTRLGARAGLIAVNHNAEIVMRHNTESLLRASVREQEVPYVAIY